MSAVSLPETLTTENNPDRLDVMGTVVTICRADASRVSFDLDAPPGTGVPMHVHDHEDEVFLIRRGKIRFVVDGRETIAGPGETVFGPRGLAHSWEVFGDEMVDAIVTILPGNLELMFRDLAALPKGPPDLARIGEICGRHGVRFV